MRNNIDKRKGDIHVMNQLNVFHIVKCRSIWRTIKNFPRCIKWAWQRVTKGYCDADTWDLDKYYPRLIKATLLAFKENNDGCPWDKSIAEWDNLLQTVLDKLDYVISDPEEENPYPPSDHHYYDFFDAEEAKRREVYRGILNFIADNSKDLWW